jgi:hypothetical protein
MKSMRFTKSCRAEDRRAGGLEAGGVGAPERRVGRQRQQEGDVDPHAVGDVDGLVGVVDGHVDVDPEDQLLAGDELEARDQLAVARARHHAGVLPHREGVSAGGSDGQALARGGLLRRPPQLAQLLAGLLCVLARSRRYLADGLEQLGLHFAHQVLGNTLEERLDGVREVERLRVDDHQLLLHPDGVGGPRE